MVNTPETFDLLYELARMRDPLRCRHGLSRAQYGTAFELPDSCRRVRGDTANRLLQLLAAFVLGATAAMLLC